MSQEDNFKFLAPYFRDLKLIGTGGSGIVYSAVDVETDERVALKRLVLRDQLNCKAALRQVRVLQNLHHENVVGFLKVVDSRGRSLTEHVKRDSEAFMIQELVETDLHRIISSNGSLQIEHIKLFLYQLLRGLKYLHSANVIHRDAKPSNLFVDSETLLLKIGDFGQCRILDTDYDHTAKLTHKPSSLWYRAPEVSFTPFSYDSSVDIWSAGCVFAEMLLGKPLFEGKHELEQIELILDCIPLSEEDRGKVKIQMPEKSLNNNPGMSLKEKFSEPDLEALDLLEKMLQFNPEKRITAAEALAHPFLREYAFPSDEPICSSPLHIEHEVDDFPEDLLKDMILEECLPVPDKEQPFLEEVVVEKPLEPLDNILSLKEIMTDAERDEPVASRTLHTNSFDGEKSEEQVQLECDVKQRLGVESIREGHETLAAAMMFQGLFNGEQGSCIRDEKDIKSLDPDVLSNVFSKTCINDKFTCRKNVLAGPFGLYYL